MKGIYLYRKQIDAILIEIICLALNANAFLHLTLISKYNYIVVS